MSVISQTLQVAGPVGALETLLDRIAAHKEKTEAIKKKVGADNVAISVGYVGLIPSIEYLRGGPYRIVPDLAIASRGPVASVAIFTTTAALPSTSRNDMLRSDTRRKIIFSGSISFGLIPSSCSKSIATSPNTKWRDFVSAAIGSIRFPNASRVSIHENACVPFV